MHTLMHFKQFVDELSVSNSRNYKLTILEKYKDDSEIKFYLNFIYDPYKVTGISDKKLKMTENISASLFSPALPFNNTVFDCLNYILNNNTGSYEVLELIGLFKDTEGINDNPELLELFNKVITKNFQLGIDVKSINKVIPSLIPEFNVMLANKYFENPEYVEGKSFTLTTKIDGGRIVAIKKNGEVNFYTRQGQKYEGLIDLDKEMLEKIPENTCFDGEITLLSPYEIEYDENSNPAIGRKLSSKEQYKQTMMITRKNGEKHGVKMLVFDIMTADQFITQSCPTPYYKRREQLEQLFSQVSLTYFEKLDNLYTGTDTNEIIKILNEKIAQEEEGVMINLSDAPYEFKRTNSLLKVKKMQDADLEIIGYQEGSNSNKGKLGAFIVDYKGNKLRVGSGYSKELREEIWKHPDDYIGLTIAVQYFEETQNQNGGTSLRFPVFLDFRYDK